jgi:Na+-translocating ferredoxin:NAD+ oxidoreductase RnfG subunit
MRNLGVKKKFEDTKSEAVNRRTDNTCNGQKKKRTNNDIQNITQETKDRATLTPLKTGGELGYSGRVSLIFDFVQMGTFFFINNLSKIN